MSARASLRGSVALLGGILLVALVGLGLDGNWPKVLRVAAAGSAYAAVLLVLDARRVGSSFASTWWPFAVSGLAAGVSSGLLRPGSDPTSILIDSVAAMLLATVHWLALGLAARTRRRITAGEA